MYYIDENAFGPRAVAKRRMTPAPVRVRRAAVDADTSFANGITTHVLAPSHVSVEDAAASASATANGIRLVRVGFTIALPPDVMIQWMRLIVRIIPATSARGEDGSPRIVAVYPSRIDYPIVVHGRIAVDGTGNISREQVPADRDSTASASYHPNVLGLTTAAKDAVWNWIPATGRPPIGSDALFMSIASSLATAPRYRQSLHVVIRREGSDDEVVLEQIVESPA